MFRMTLRRRPWLLLTLLACSTWLSAAANSAVPAGYQFNGVGDTFTANLADTSPTRQRYDTRVMAIATAVNNQGQVIGFWKQSDGQFRSHSFRKATNPAFSILDTPDFVSLTASDVSCWMFFTALICPNDNAFGIRIVPPAVEGDPVTGFTAQITPNDAALIAGSMPLMLNPGNFSSENAAGVIATTQVSADSQFGVIVHAGGQIALPAVPWLIAINDLTEPLLLAYDGDDGDCLVYGEGCSDDDDWCEDRDGKRHHGHGRGHEEHGNGNGYGHDDCTCGGSGTSRSLLRAGGIPIDLSGGGGGDDTHIVVPETAAAGALLLRLNADASLVAYRFPAQADGHAVTHLFPLAINFNRAVLRGDIQNGSRLLDKRLLSCQLDPAALDANDDGIVDCVGGMTVIGGTANSIRAGTVLGFELNDSGRLIGNDGYNAAGVGAPFVVDLGATSSAATPLADLITGADNWEINTVTDINASGRITGYGYRDCSA